MPILCLVHFKRHGLRHTVHDEMYLKMPSIFLSRCKIGIFASQLISTANLRHTAIAQAWLFSRNQSVFSRWNHRVQTFCIFTAKLCTEFANPDENANFVRFRGQTLQIICTLRKPAASPISSVRKSYSKLFQILYGLRIFPRKYVFCTVNALIYCTFYVRCLTPFGY